MFVVHSSARRHRPWRHYYHTEAFVCPQLHSLSPWARCSRARRSPSRLEEAEEAAEEAEEYAYALAKAERYQEALDILDMLHDSNTPRAWNYRGYATRKLGRTEEGVGYYLRSLALDPNYAQVREYLGEAYVIEGKLELAKDQLHTIQKLCGSTECEEYEDLSQAINKAQDL